mmetsp:Transcript_133403/g.231763  ORF Transcript_133403/g.231763 Transcript_133403/m.231763 type:complete len:165 (+) Transcript_133403:100-594(+)
MTPPFTLPLVLFDGKNFPPPNVVPLRTKCSDVSRVEVPMVMRGDVVFTDIDSRLSTLYAHGPGPTRAVIGRHGAVDQEPRIEYDGESRPKHELRPAVAVLEGLVYLEKRFTDENPLVLSLSARRLSPETDDASVAVPGRLAPSDEGDETNRSAPRGVFLRDGGA